MAAQIGADIIFGPKGLPALQEGVQKGLRATAESGEYDFAVAWPL